jgi:hypothetical protein
MLNATAHGRIGGYRSIIGVPSGYHLRHTGCGEAVELVKSSLNAEKFPAMQLFGNSFAVLPV